MKFLVGYVINNQT